MHLLIRRVLIPAAIFAFLLAGFTAFGQTPPHDKPGPASDKLLFRAFDVDRASRDLQAGNMDLYMFGLKIDAAERLQRDDKFSLYQAPASTVSLLLNPASAPRGELNPFSIPDVRRAVQFLINREFIAQDIYRGTASPMISHVSPQDHDYLTVYDIEAASGITFDPDYARALISEAMTDAGAKKEGGSWIFGGQPVRIKLIGRVEDERRNIADLLRAELERVGFQVAVNYMPFAAAINSVYSTDPATFQWHIYTEGWGRSSLSRYDFATVNSMSAPWLGNMPGWQEIGFWQYMQDELDDLGKKLFRGEFRTEEERDTIYRRMTELSIDESVRIWLVTAVNSFPARADVEGISRDPVAGLRSMRTLREAYIPGKSELKVGHLWVWTERTTWNPIGGISDVYSADIWKYLHDSPLANHPFTGVPEPIRADFEIATSGPDRSITIPADAMLWNAERDEWQSAGGGRAISKVTFDYSKYFDSKWHHGEPITMADVVYSIAQGYELAYDKNKSRIEVAIGITSRPFLETFRGYRVIDESRLEVYVDYWHFEKNLIAGYASPVSLSMPWEVLAAMDDLVFEQRRAAYSATAGSRFNVPWISLVMDRDANLVERTLKTFKKEQTIPKGVFDIGPVDLVSQSAAADRYQASLDWVSDYGHMVISNGPFYLSRYDPPAQFAELTAFRDPTYPYRPGDWYFGDPPAFNIEPVQGVQVTPGEDAIVTISVNGPGKLGLRYLLVDPVTREVVLKEEAVETGSRGIFSVTIPGKISDGLFPGLYELSLVAYSDSVATVTDRSVDVDVTD
ncbi:MAG: hypothetical protein HN368_17885 [Spirochaetales bacterium]|nr:hypothetical protein [Spirochaetales bacterium]